MNRQHDSRHYLLHEAIQQLGWDSDVQALVKKVRGLERGLPYEDEISFLFNWLGRCRMVHKLDQFQIPPASRAQYQVPDLVAFFDHRGQTVPVLIEVKSCEESSLSWKPDYRERLSRYADSLHLPLLIAWRHKTLWTLFEATNLRRAKKNFNIRFEDALKQTLMCKLAGDFSFSFRKGAGLHLNVQKKGRAGDEIEGVIVDAYWTNGDGRRFNNVQGLMPLFLSSYQEQNVTETDSHIAFDYVTTDEHNAQFAHRALVSLLRFSTDRGQLIWRHVLDESRVPPLVRVELRSAAREALKLGFLQIVANIRPATAPAFIP